MPFTPPTRAEILQRVKGDVRSEIGADPLRRSPEYALSRALTGQSKGLYGFLRYIFAQCFADTAESFYFWRWMTIFGLSQKPAVPWRGVVSATGTNGTTIPAATHYSRSDGLEYTVDADVVIASGTATPSLTAVIAGVAGQNEPGQPLTLVSPIAGVDPVATVTSTTQTASDAESEQDGLARLLEDLRNPPHGGGPGDYVRWALEVPGVTRAWEFPLASGPNTVSVAFVRDNDGAGAAIIPDSGERATVQAYLDAHVPITVAASVIVLVAQPVNVQISALAPNTPTVQAAIGAELNDLFSREGEPAHTIVLSRLDNAISNADGETSHVLDTPGTDVVSTITQIPVLGTLVFV